MVDTYCKFVILAALPDCSSATIAHCIRECLIATFGVPLSFHVDNGSEFAGDVVSLCSTFGMRCITTSPFHSPTNGQVECY